MGIFMKVKDITGSSKGKRHDGWIMVQEVSFGATVDIEVAPDEGAERIAKHTLKKIQITKSAGGSSPALMAWMIAGEVKAEVKLEICKEAGDCYLRYVLTDVVLEDYTLKMGEEGDSTINLELVYDEVLIEQITFDAQNKPLKGAPKRVHAKREKA